MGKAVQWSQLKTRVEALFAAGVKGRVELRTSRYHKAHDQMGRAWITVDGREIISMCSFAADVAHYREATRLREASGCLDYCAPEQREGYRLAHDQADVILEGRAIFSRGEFHASLFEYLNLSIEEILSSEDPIIRGIGMLDRRVGKRGLRKMDPSDENPFVVELFGVRHESELQY